MDKKLKKVLEMRTDSPVMLESLEAISGFFEGDKAFTSTLDARRSLRDDLEKQNYHLSVCFLKSFERLKGRLEGLDTHVYRLEDGCRGITERLAEADSRMRQFSERAEALRHQQSQLAARAEQASSFLALFQLSAEEQASLRASLDDPQEAQRFFSVLSRLREVRAECARMAGMRHQAAGFELLDALSRDQETAYGRLYGWVQERCQQQDLQEETPAADLTLQLAVRALRDRPVFFCHCQESILAMRRKLLLQRFVTALTQGSAQRHVRPIEIQAHDPVRYVGDMLAWVHQAIAVEKELLNALFGSPAAQAAAGGGTAGADPHSSAAAADATKAEAAAAAAANGEASSGMDHGVEVEVEGATPLSAGEVLVRVLAGIAQPLHGRISTVLHDNVDVAIGYRLAHLLSFYCDTVNRLLDTVDSSGGSRSALPKPGTAAAAAAGSAAAGGGRGGALTDAMADCRKRAHARVLAVLKQQGDRLLAAPPRYTPDLGSLPATVDTAQRLGSILAAHAASMSPVDAADAEGEGDVLLLAVLEATIEPALTSCRMSAEGLDPSDTAILMLNNAAPLAAALVSPASSAAGAAAADAVAAGAATPWRERLAQEVKTWLAVLVDHQAERILERCGLSRVLHQLELTAGHGVPASTRPGIDEATLAVVMRAFYTSLFALVVPDFERLSAPEVKAAARQRTAAKVAEAHDTVYAAVLGPANGYEDTSFLLHTPEQVRMILDLEPCRSYGE